MTVKYLQPDALEFLTQVYLDFSIDDGPIHRLKIELFDDVVPKTAENFLQLCLNQEHQKGFKGMYFTIISPLSRRRFIIDPLASLSILYKFFYYFYGYISCFERMPFSHYLSSFSLLNLSPN